MTSATIDAVRVGETCSACGEEMTLELLRDGEVQVGCGCSCASALWP